MRTYSTSMQRESNSVQHRGPICYNQHFLNLATYVTIHLLYMETSKLKIQFATLQNKCHEIGIHFSKIKTNYYLVYIYLLPTSNIFPSMPLADWQHSAKSTFWRFSSDSYTKTTHTLCWAKMERNIKEEEKNFFFPFSYLKKKFNIAGCFPKLYLF